VKLLRFLEDRTIIPLGGTEPVTVNLRTIAATNRDLEKHVADERFRQDLYWRLNVVPIHLPPLRERREDVSVLATHFLDRYGKGTVRGFTVDAMIVLSCYPWPGNVRELENTVERMVVMNAGKELLELEDIPASIRENAETPEEVLSGGEPQAYQDALRAFERDYLIQLFRKSKGNISQAARLAGVSRSYIHQKIKKLDLDPGRFKD
jgi:DNA-binding NtrC family response regulator